jgi:ribosomal protein S18 acetylase RimI-like enzyme
VKYLRVVERDAATRRETVSLRDMEMSDLDFAIKMTDKEGWAYSRIELERIMDLDPEGSFIFEDEGRPLGFVTSAALDNTGVVGHLVVSSEGRGRRIGRQLIDRAVSHFDESRVESSILFATDDGIPLYEKLGFRSDAVAVSIGFMRDVEQREVLAGDCELVRPDDLDEIISIDASLYGAERPVLIRRLYAEFPQHCVKLVRGGCIEGFAFARRTPIGSDIGPWMTTTGSMADGEALFNTVLRSVPAGRVDLGIFDVNLAAHELICPYRTIKVWPTTLMVRGGPRYSGPRDRTFGILAFELG